MQDNEVAAYHEYNSNLEKLVISES